MSNVFNLMEEVVDEAKQHTDETIANVSKSLLPYFIDLQYSFIRNQRYRYNNETIHDENHLIMKVEGIKNKRYYVNSKNESIYRMNVWDAVKRDVIYPFILFINGYHVKWSDITIVRDIRYTYLLLPKTLFKKEELRVNLIKNIKCIHIPFNIFYTESREKAPNDGYINFLRFSLDGELIDSGKVIYYLKHPKLIYKEYSFAGIPTKGYDLEIDHNYRLSGENFLVFKNRLLDNEMEVYVNRMNLLFTNNADEEAKYKIKCFYRTDINVPYNTINKFSNIDLAKSIAQGKVKNDYIDTKILNTDFNFSSDNKKSYNMNVKTGFRYITSYDSKFLSKVYEKVNYIETKSMTGEEIRKKVNNFGVLKMSLLKYKQKTTRVIIFCNGNLYHRYSDIQYTMNSFTIPIDMNTLDDNDEFELVFIKNINNYQEIIRYTEDNKYKTQDPFEDDELALYTQSTDDHFYKDKVMFNDRSWFPVDYEIKKGNVIIDKKYNNTDILYATKNRFAYYFRNIQEENIKIRLSEDFKICTNENQYVVFLNGRLMNREFYRLLIPSKDNVFTDPYIYSRVKFHKGDKIEVFYMPVEFKDMDYSGNLVTRVVTMKASKDNQLSFVIPYPFKLYTYRQEFVVFKDGVFVDPDRYKAKNGILMFTDGTYIEKGSQLSFIFLYDKSEKQEAAIYINNDNGIYMEHIYLQVTRNGQTRFDLGDDKYIDYLMEGNSIMVLYHGMYVPSEYWEINKYTGVLTFAPNTFKEEDYLTVILFHLPDELNQKSYTIDIDEDWKTTLEDETLSGFPFIHRSSISTYDLMEWGSDTVTKRTVNIGKKLVTNKANMLSDRLDLEEYSTTYNGYDSVSITGFPFVYINKASMYNILDWSKSEFQNNTIELARKMIHYRANLLDYNTTGLSIGDIELRVPFTYHDYFYMSDIYSKGTEAFINDSMFLIKNVLNGRMAKEDSISRKLGLPLVYYDSIGIGELLDYGQIKFNKTAINIAKNVINNRSNIVNTVIDDYSGLAYLYHYSGTMKDLFDNGTDNFIEDNLNRFKENINKLINEKIDDSTEFPFTYHYSITELEMLDWGKSKFVNYTINNIKKLLNNRIPQEEKSMIVDEEDREVNKEMQYPFNYHTTISSWDLLEWGRDNFLTFSMDQVKDLILKNNDISEDSNKKVFMVLPFIHRTTESFINILNYGKTNFNNQTIDIAKKLINNKSSGATIITEDITDEGIKFNGVVRTETKLIAKYDYQSELDSDNISKYPANISVSKPMLDITDIAESNLINASTNIINDKLEELKNDTFDISEYIGDNKPMFIMKNNVLLTEGYHYIIIREENKIKFMEPLMKGDKIYLVTYNAKGKSIRSYEHDILVEDPTQTTYDLFNIFGQLDRAKCRFMIYVGSLVLDPRRYEMIDGGKLVFNDTSMLVKGQHIRIIALYVDEETKSLYTYNNLGSTKYHSINNIDVDIEKDVYTYTIPYPDDDYEAGFIIMAGGLIVDQTRYEVNKYDRTITFKHTHDPFFEEHTKFTFVFLRDDIKTISVDTGLGDRIQDRRYTYNIPVPFPNYFEQGNNILVFSGSLLLNANRYTIDKENNLITLNEDVRIEDTNLRFMFIYHTSSKNISYLDEDVTVSTIRKNGYVMMNKDNLDHPLSKSLFWLFINGKKVNMNNIADVSTNMVRITKDQRSRYNVVLLSHTPKIAELETFFNTYSNYDTLINNMRTEDLNQLFNEHRILTDTEVHHDMDVTKEALVTEIKRDWYGRTGIYAGNQFIDTYTDITRATDKGQNTETKEIHSMVADASQFFSARLNRDNTNQMITER